MKTEAIVLRSIRYGEADRILHLYTPFRDRQARSPKGRGAPTTSRFGARLEPFSHVGAVLHEGRSERASGRGRGHDRDPCRAPRSRGDARAASRACEGVTRLFETSESAPGVFRLLANELAQKAADAEQGRAGSGLRVPAQTAARGGHRAADTCAAC